MHCSQLALVALAAHALAVVSAASEGTCTNPDSADCEGGGGQGGADDPILVIPPHTPAGGSKAAAKENEEEDEPVGELKHLVQLECLEAKEDVLPRKEWTADGKTAIPWYNYFPDSEGDHMPITHSEYVRIPTNHPDKRHWRNDHNTLEIAFREPAKAKPPKPFASREANKACFDSSKNCFRAVYDDFVSRDTMLHLRGILSRERDENPMRFSAKDLPQVRWVAHKIINLLKEKHGIDNIKLNYANYDDQVQDKHLKGDEVYDTESLHGWERLHHDFKYKADSPLVYSALLYLTRYGPEDGGALVFADAFHGNATKGGLESGTYVFPDEARLVVFSGGAENMHTPTTVLRKLMRRRIHLALWFDCA